MFIVNLFCILQVWLPFLWSQQWVVGCRTCAGGEIVMKMMRPPLWDTAWLCQTACLGKKGGLLFWSNVGYNNPVHYFVSFLLFSKLHLMILWFQQGIVSVQQGGYMCLQVGSRSKQATSCRLSSMYFKVSATTGVSVSTPFKCLFLKHQWIFQHLEGHASLYELPADWDGGDGLLPGEVSWVWKDSSRKEKSQTTRSVQEAGW